MTRTTEPPVDDRRPRRLLVEPVLRPALPRHRRGPPVAAVGARRRHARRRGFLRRGHRRCAAGDRRAPAACPPVRRAGRPGCSASRRSRSATATRSSSRRATPRRPSCRGARRILGSFPAFVPGSPDAGVPAATPPGPGAAGRHAPRRHALLPARQRPERQHPRPARAQPRVHRRGLPAHRHDGPPGEGRVHGRAWCASRRPPTGSAWSRSAGGRGGWQVVRSGRNRRITANTPMRSPARPPAPSWCAPRPTRRGRARWAPSTTARTACTPWGTYLACEENFNGYFRVDPAPTTPRTSSC